MENRSPSSWGETAAICRQLVYVWFWEGAFSSTWFICPNVSVVDKSSLLKIFNRIINWITSFFFPSSLFQPSRMVAPSLWSTATGRSAFQESTTLLEQSCYTAAQQTPGRASRCRGPPGKISIWWWEFQHTGTGNFIHQERKIPWRFSSFSLTLPSL